MLAGQRTGDTGGSGNSCWCIVGYANNALISQAQRFQTNTLTEKRFHGKFSCICLPSVNIYTKEMGVAGVRKMVGKETGEKGACLVQVRLVRGKECISSPHTPEPIVY